MRNICSQTCHHYTCQANAVKAPQRLVARSTGGKPQGNLRCHRRSLGWHCREASHTQSWRQEDPRLGSQWLAGCQASTPKRLGSREYTAVDLPKLWSAPWRSDCQIPSGRAALPDAIAFRGAAHLHASADPPAGLHAWKQGSNASELPSWTLSACWKIKINAYTSEWCSELIWMVSRIWLVFVKWLEHAQQSTISGITSYWFSICIKMWELQDLSEGTEIWNSIWWTLYSLFHNFGLQIWNGCKWCVNNCDPRQMSPAVGLLWERSPRHRLEAKSWCQAGEGSSSSGAIHSPWTDKCFGKWIQERPRSDMATQFLCSIM